MSLEFIALEKPVQNWIDVIVGKLFDTPVFLLSKDYVNIRDQETRQVLLEELMAAQAVCYVSSSDETWTGIHYHRGNLLRQKSNWSKGSPKKKHQRVPASYSDAQLVGILNTSYDTDLFTKDYSTKKVNDKIAELLPGQGK